MIYEYFCKHCGHEFDRSLLMDDRKIPCNEPCPNCGKGPVVQKISGITIVSDHMDVQTRARKTSGEAYTEVMSQIKKQYPNSNVQV